MNRNRLLTGLLFVILTFTLTSCFTANKLLTTKGRTPIYLHTDDDLKNFSFYVDGQLTSASSLLYKSREVSRSSTTVTYEQTYLPALAVSGKKAYMVLKIVNNVTKQEQEILLKSDLKEGAKLVMYFQGMMTAGVGNLLDLSTNSIYGWPEISIN
jgi:hypothetical protein